MKPRRVLVAGTGQMAREYARVLRDGLKWEFSVTSHSANRALEFAQETSAQDGWAMDALPKDVASRFDFAVVASAIEFVPDVAATLMRAGISSLLLEKPAALTVGRCRALLDLSVAHHALVRVACNRRYYASVRHLRGLLAAERPVCAFFDFTEWPSVIGPLPRPTEVKARWAVMNSIHVIDTVNFLLGPMHGIHHHVGGVGELDWHPSGATYVGAASCGATPVSWATSWVAPGRWNIEVMTREGRYKLSPMEQLQVMRPKSVQWTAVEIDDGPDKAFKPGLRRMLESFSALLDRPDHTEACDLPDLVRSVETLTNVNTLVGYSE